MKKGLFRFFTVLTLLFGGVFAAAMILEYYDVYSVSALLEKFDYAIYIAIGVAALFLVFQLINLFAPFPKKKDKQATDTTAADQGAAPISSDAQQYDFFSQQSFAAQNGEQFGGTQPDAFAQQTYGELEPVAYGDGQNDAQAVTPDSDAYAALTQAEEILPNTEDATYGVPAAAEAVYAPVEETDELDMDDEFVTDKTAEFEQDEPSSQEVLEEMLTAPVADEEPAVAEPAARESAAKLVKPVRTTPVGNRAPAESVDRIIEKINAIIEMVKDDEDFQ